MMATPPQSRLAVWGRILLPGALAVSGITVAMWASTQAGSPSVHIDIVAGLTLAFLAARLLTLQLPQGDEVCVTLIVGVVGLLTWDIVSVLMAAAIAGLLDVSVRLSYGPRTRVATRMMDVIRSVAVLALMSSSRAVMRYLPDWLLTGDGVVLFALVVGSAYILVDVVTLSLQQWLGGGAGVPDGVRRLSRPLAPVYLVQIAMAAVVLRVHGYLGAWGFLIALMLTLILQNSFSLYLRIKRAYAQTIGALAHAAELDRPQDVGHAQRVADMAVEAGRKLGLSSNELERVGYGALLHDLGRIGRDEPENDRGHSTRGAQIVTEVPFLDGVAPLIEHHRNMAGPDAPLGAMIIGVCCRYDRLRQRHGAHIALGLLREDEVDGRRKVVQVLEELVDAQGGRAQAARSAS